MEPVLRPEFLPDWMAAVVLLSLLLVIVTKEKFTYRFSVFIRLMSNTKYVLLFNKKQAYLHPFQFIWQIFAILNTSLFLYLQKEQIASVFGNKAILNFSFAHILCFVAGFILLKQLLQLLHAALFNNRKIIEEFLFKKSSYFYYANLIFCVSNLISLFLVRDHMLLFFIPLACVFTFTLVGWLVILRNRQKYISEQFFYFILYLCALEIAPFLIIGSIL